MGSLWALNILSANIPDLLLELSCGISMELFIYIWISVLGKDLPQAEGGMLCRELLPSAGCCAEAASEEGKVTPRGQESSAASDHGRGGSSRGYGCSNSR